MIQFSFEKKFKTFSGYQDSTVVDLFAVHSSFLLFFGWLAFIVRENQLRYLIQTKSTSYLQTDI